MWAMIYTTNNAEELSTKLIYFHRLSWGQRFKIYKMHEHLYKELRFSSLQKKNATHKRHTTTFSINLIAYKTTVCHSVEQKISFEFADSQVSYLLVSLTQ